MPCRRVGVPQVAGALASCKISVTMRLSRASKRGVVVGARKNGPMTQESLEPTAASSIDELTVAVEPTSVPDPVELDNPVGDPQEYMAPPATEARRFRQCCSGSAW